MRLLFSATLLLFSSAILSQNIDFQAADPHPEIQGALFGDLEFADIDNDGDLDIFACGRIDGWISESRSTLYLNDGQGNFNPVDDAGITDMQSATAHFADLDGDDDEDLLLCGLVNSTPTAQLYANDGLGNFSLLEDSPFEDSKDGDIAIGDVNGDELLDVYLMGTDVSGFGFNHLYINQGEMQFVNVNATPFLNIDNGSVELVDLDGDDDLDLFMIGSDIEENPVSIMHLNDGAGNFNSAPSGIADFHEGDFAFADMDGDEDLDVILSGAKEDGAAYTELYLNDGTGSFTVSSASDVFPELSLGENHCEDLDQDGDMDIILTGTADGGLGSDVGIITNIFENQGDNTYVLADSLTGAYVARTALGDLDGDMDLDLLISGTTVGAPTFKTWVYINETDIRLDLNEENEEGLKIFPNPSNGIVTILFPGSTESIIEIYSLNGELLRTESGRDQFHALDLNLDQGIYTLVVRVGEVSIERKISIVR